MKLIIPMAGRGTRVRPHSHVTPKPLLPVSGKSIVERIVDTFQEVLPEPISEAVFVLGPDFGDGVKKMLTGICTPKGIVARFCIQHEALGTAHAVYAAEEFLVGKGVVVFADTLFAMAGPVDVGDSDVVAWVKTIDDPSRFGVAVREGDRVVALVEKPSEPISNEALIGIYYLRDLSLLRESIKHLMENKVTGHGGEYQLTDAFDKLLKDGRAFTTEGVTEWLDCGTIEALLETTILILAKESGSTVDGGTSDSKIIPPVYLGAGVKIKSSTVGPNVSVEAGTTITDSKVSNSILFARSQVERSTLDDSLVGSEARVIGYSGTLNIGDHSVVGGQ